MVRMGRSTPLGRDVVGRGPHAYPGRSSSIRRCGGYWVVLDPILELPIAFGENERGSGIFVHKRIFSPSLTEPQIFATLLRQKGIYHLPVATISESSRRAQSLPSQRRQTGMGSVVPVPEQILGASLSRYLRDHPFGTDQSTVNHSSFYNALNNSSVVTMIGYQTRGSRRGWAFGQFTRRAGTHRASAFYSGRPSRGSNRWHAGRGSIQRGLVAASGVEPRESRKE